MTTNAAPRVVFTSNKIEQDAWSKKAQNASDDKLADLRNRMALAQKEHALISKEIELKLQLLDVEILRRLNERQEIDFPGNLRRQVRTRFFMREGEWDAFYTYILDRAQQLNDAGAKPTAAFEVLEKRLAQTPFKEEVDLTGAIEAPGVYASQVETIKPVK